MIKFICTLVSVFILSTGFAQPGNFSIAAITDSMKKNANSVLREERLEFEVRSVDKAYYNIHKVITILNEAGKSELFFYEFSDKFRSLEDVSIESFDSHNGTRRKFTKSDLTKQSTGEGLVPDGNIYYLDIPVTGYPVTIITDYTIKMNGLLNYPDYQLQVPEQSVENSVFIAKVPVELDMRYKSKNTLLAPVISEAGKYKTYTWSVKNLTAMENEEGSVSVESRFPKILISPVKFELDGYQGDMSSWQSFGKWYGALAKDAINLSEERKIFFNEMVKNIPDDKEKIKALYSYLQNNFRYVSIQLGIGGFKPFSADFVDKKKYGDCKALSNYMQASLQAIGLKSYQALINASYNKEPVDPDFPHNSFNHVIICVPMDKDSVWLECTSTTNEFGKLGTFTENRNALLITEEGGKLVATPVSKAAENRFGCSSIINLNEDGSGTATVQITATGEYKQDFLNYIFDQKKDAQKKYLVNDIGFLQPDDFVIDYDKENKQAPVKLQLEIEKIPDFSAGNKQFLNPRIYKIWSQGLPKAENRTQDFYFHRPFIKTDTTIYKLPEGFGVETLPGAKDLKFEFGAFKCTYTFDEKQKSIITTVRLELTAIKIPAAKFLVAKKFFNHVLGEYTEKIVIKKL